MDVNEIFKAWKTSLNPSKDQSVLGQERFEICKKCEFRIEIVKNKEWSFLCGKCGCPLKKLIFSSTFNACKEGKWREVDSKHKVLTEEKKDTSII